MIDLQVERVDPQTAENWLGGMGANRALSDTRVRRLAAAILRGEWEVNGDTIKFDPNGRLIDGQHRLAAIVESGVAVTTSVARNVNGRAFATFDTGMRRNLGQVLRLEGEANAAALAAAINLLFPYAEGHDPRTRTHNTPTYAQALAFLNANPELRESVSVGQHVKAVTRSNLTALIVSHFLFSRLDEEGAATFFNLLHTPIGLSAGDPILVLRNRLGAGTPMKRESHTHTSVIEWALITKAWNAWREGRHVSVINWKSGGARSEAFPEAC